MTGEDYITGCSVLGDSSNWTEIVGEPVEAVDELESWVEILGEGYDILGAPSWDNSLDYAKGSKVQYWSKVYQATRDISAPFLPSLQSGEVPGESDAWTVVGEDVIPTAGQNYDNDSVTVLAVQQALKAKGFNPGPLDGTYGPKTAAAVKALQGSLGAGQSGVIDEGVISALKVTPGVASGTGSQVQIYSSSYRSAPSFSSAATPGAAAGTPAASTQSSALKYGLLAGGAALLLGGVVALAVRK